MKYSALVTALASFLALTSGCAGRGNTQPQVQEIASEANSQTAGEGGVEPVKPQTLVPLDCKNVPLAACDKKFFGEQRCEKSGQVCVELQEIPSTGKRCDQLSNNECGKSHLCKPSGTVCQERQHVFESPCKDLAQDSCLTKNTCLFDSVIQRCGKNPYAGRCVFDTTKCVLNGDGNACANNHGGACQRVEVADGGECQLNTNVCTILNSGNGAVTGPTGVKLTTSKANNNGAKAKQDNGIISHDAERTSAAICIGDPANVEENNFAIPNPAAANACQDIFGKELADRLAKNTAIADSYETNLQSYPRICSSLVITGAKEHNDDGAADEVRNDDIPYFYQTGVAYADLSDGGNHRGDVNRSGWCDWVPKIDIQCLRGNVDPCQGAYTKEGCASKTECLWETLP